ncbi:MAG: dienelactone hydrolase [Pirellulaceae bacterium]|jgi:dienelactone hydrolase
MNTTVKSVWKPMLVVFVLSLLPLQIATAIEPRVYDGDAKPNDSRLAPPKDLNGYFPFVVPAGKEKWKQRQAELRQQVLVATGLWPLPERTPMNPVIRPAAKREGFTVEKVYFESYPGHFVTGLLFRPDDGKKDVRRPAVLCPHGHGGRMQDYGEKTIRQLINDGAERFEESGRYPKLARSAQLARMGCVVFIFDMLGYADSVQISYELAHRFGKQRPEFENKGNFGLYSAQAEMRLQSIMGIQTWNSVRCLDFLQSLPDVDGSRIGVTGGSGGGTQTILLCAIDDRPTVAFPNGMVSTSMQGGCTCENCSLLRIGTGNVELAAVFAPKPQAMTAANDWTKEMLTKGYPELQKVYGMLGAKDQVYCRNLLHFPHNYNYVSRATMYKWFNKYLKLGLEEPVVEENWIPLTAEEASVWNGNPPAGGDDYERNFNKYLAKASDAQIAAIVPKDNGALPRYQEVIGGGWATLIGRKLPASEDIERTKVDKQKQAGFIYFEDILRLKSVGEELPVISVYPTKADWNGDVVVWADGNGKKGILDANGNLNATVQKLVDGGASVVAADLFQQGEFLANGPLTQQRVVGNTREAAAFTMGYNHTLFAHRVHDLLTVISWAHDDEHKAKRVHLVGANGAGPIAAAARAVAGKSVDKAAIDTAGFRFANLTSYRDVNFLPGAVKYGDLPALLALSAPNALWVTGENGKTDEVVRKVFSAANSKDEFTSSPMKIEAAADWLLD